MEWTLGMTVRWALICYWSSGIVFLERRRKSLLLVPRPIGRPVLLVLDLAFVATYPLVRVMYDDRLRRAVRFAATGPLRRTIHRASDPLLRGRRVVLHRRPRCLGPHRVER